MPMPVSTLPRLATTAPSAPIAIQESSASAGMTAGQAAAGSAAATAGPVHENEITRAPALLRKSRRDIAAEITVSMNLLGFLHARGGELHRAKYAHVRAAAALE